MELKSKNRGKNHINMDQSYRKIGEIFIKMGFYQEAKELL